MLRKALSQSWASASSAAGHNNNHVAALLAQVRPGAQAAIGGSFGTTVQPARGQKSLPVVDAAAPLPPAAYSPFGTKQKSMGEWTVARLDDLLNWGRKGKRATTRECITREDTPLPSCPLIHSVAGLDITFCMQW